MAKTLLQSLPSLEILLNDPQLVEFSDKFGREVLLKTAREVLDHIRRQFRLKSDAELPTADNASEWIVARIVQEVSAKYGFSLKKAINATGVVLHTGLGRAVLPEAAIQSINDVIEGYCTLATSIETGRRGHRDGHLNDLICELTGAEAATVVNNNAAATMLILNTLAQGKEVILSRGQLVEIGGAFRMPDVMETSGAKLRDVGTTNKTHLRDYANAIGEETGALMRVHHSNYRIVGFSSEPSVQEIADLAHERGLHMIDDIGSGALIDLGQFGLEKEPLIKDSIKAGADVICFSGDKLIGGPQAGIIVGKAKVIEKIKKNQLGRAMRVGKTTIAGLQATLQLFLRPDTITKTHPVYRMFAARPVQLARRANRMRRALEPALDAGVSLEVVDSHAQVGSGSVPAETMPSKSLRILSSGRSEASIAQQLRLNDPPIFTRLHKNGLYLDFKTFDSSQDIIVKSALQHLLGAKTAD